MSAPREDANNVLNDLANREVELDFENAQEQRVDDEEAERSHRYLPITRSFKKISAAIAPTNAPTPGFT